MIKTNPMESLACRIETASQEVVLRSTPSPDAGLARTYVAACAIRWWIELSRNTDKRGYR